MKILFIFSSMPRIINMDTSLVISNSLLILIFNFKLHYLNSALYNAKQ
jgi:hypothetical protein